MPFGTVVLARIVARGHIGGTQTWSTGFWVSYGVPDGTYFSGQGAINSYATAMDVFLKTMWTSMAALNSADTSFESTAVFLYSANATVPDGQGESAPRAALTGGSGAYLPTQSSLVLSLRTALPGRQGRGRMYWPCTGASMAIGHQLADANVDNAALAAKTMINSVNAYVTGPYPITQKVAVVSWVGSHVSLVTSVRVDSEIDIQRRRADRMPVLHVATQAVA